MKFRTAFMYLSLLIVSNYTLATSKDSLRVFAAASCYNLIEEVSELYTSKTGVKVVINTASSGVLAKQIINGASADIYISASVQWVDYLTDFLVSKDSFLSNTLVLIKSKKVKDAVFTANDYLPDFFVGRLSIGDPNHVPAGSYAKEVLEYYNWYSKLKKRILPAANVRDALTMVELGEVDFGIVYKTDALISSKVDIVYEFPKDSHSPLNYYSALISNNFMANNFYTFLLVDSEAEKIYKNYGFSSAVSKE